MNQSANMYQSYLELARSLDLNRDDTVFIASDIGRMAKDARANGESFSADLFVESFQQVLTEGTLIIPAYTDNLTNDDIFDRDLSKPTTGALSNKIMRRKDFRRTSDPLHSVWVWGKHSDAILAQEDVSTFGPQSIFGFLHEVKAKMVIIDVHLQNSFTFVHYVEERLKVKYRKPYSWIMHIREGETTSPRKLVFYTKRAGILTDLYNLQETWRKDGTIRFTRWGQAEIQFIELDKAYDALVKYIREGKHLYRFRFVNWLKTKVKRLIGRK